MAISTRLEMRQGQQLVMTPQLQQAIRLLQYSNIELTAFVETELERNPILERDDAAPEPVEASAADAEISAAGEADEWLDLKSKPADATDAFDTEFENVYPDSGASDRPQDEGQGQWAALKPAQRSSFEADDTNLEAFVAAEVCLKDHLSQLAALSVKDPIERIVAQHLIDLVDEAGYVQGDLVQLGEKLGAPAEMIERVLGILQTFEPTGVCARTLAECLALQLKEQNRYDPQIGRLLDHLHLLAQHNLPALKRAVGCDSDDLADMIAEIKKLNPKPGLKFGSIQIQPIVPDVVVRAASDGSWRVELNMDTLPRVLVNRSYYANVSNAARSDKDKGYLLDCLQNANWLVKSLDQRARTILRVAEEIVRQQDGFLTYGVQHLRPMNLKTVAEKIQMHESTVSRVTSNKYMATPRGIFELKYFFTSAIAASDGDGEAHSSEAVRHRIRTLIDAEPASDILSDDKIVERLKSDGVDIARRTVAKYRESMRIPSSVQRRREKAMAKRLSRAS
jgi:RNA polymerase sigma-54 factor